MGRPAAEETINDPNNPRHYWRYRIHYTLEDVLEDEPLISDLQALLLGGCLAGNNEHVKLYLQLSQVGMLARCTKWQSPSCRHWAL
jgi:hypothetical protein